MSRCFERYRKLLYVMTIVFLLTPQHIRAGFSVGTEITSMLSVGLNAGIEYGPIRAEIGAHYFVLSSLDMMITQGEFPNPRSITAIYKAVISAKFTPWKNHALYGGVGSLWKFDREYDHYAVSVGPAFQYAWRFPSKKLELSIDLLVPLHMFHDYIIDPEDDFPSAAGLLGFMFFLMGPTIGISWTI